MKRSVRRDLLWIKQTAESTGDATMGGNAQYSATNGERQPPHVAIFRGEAAVLESSESAERWRSPLSEDRPVYDCPDCSQRAMQFYPEHPAHPGRGAFSSATAARASGRFMAVSSVLNSELLAD